MSDPEFSYKLLREKFIERDNKALNEWNEDYHMHSTNYNLQFVSNRLEDLCGVVMKLLEELQKDLPRDK